MAKDHNEELHETEPELYDVACPKGFRYHVFGGKRFDVGFCVNSPGGNGYCDDRMVWINDDLENPEHFLDACIHESLHAIFPEMEEARVGDVSTQISSFVIKAFKGKGKRLPLLKPYATPEMRERYFSSSTARGERDRGENAP